MVTNATKKKDGNANGRRDALKRAARILRRVEHRGQIARIARELSVSHTTISLCLSGRLPLSKSWAQRIADAVIARAEKLAAQNTISEPKSPRKKGDK